MVRRIKGPPKTKTKDPLAGAVVLKQDKKVLNDKVTRRNRVGGANRATLYRPEYCRIAQKLIAGGSTQFEVSQDLGIAETTLYKWCSEYPEFALALRGGFEIADNRVEHALFSKATGHKWVEEVKSKTINDEGEEVEEVTQISKQLPPDNSAIFFWLKNRRAHKWKDKHEITVNQNITVVNSQELNQLIADHMIDGDFKVVEDDQSKTG